MTRLVLEPGEELGREVEPGGRRRGGAGIARIHRLVALAVGRRLAHVRRQRQRPVGLPGEPHHPAPRAEWLDELDGRSRATTSELLAGAQPSRGPGERLPALVPEAFDEQHLDLAARLAAELEPGGDDARVVDDRQVPIELPRQLCERPLPDVPEPRS